MSIYVKLDEDYKGPKDDVTKNNKKGEGKVVPPAPPMIFPNDDSLHAERDALFTESQEYTRPIHCEVIGKMPSWVHGTFLRVGPGRYEWGESKAGHFFDGDAIAHRFTIADGKVTYQSKFLKSEYHRKNEKYNRISASGFGTWAPPDPCANIFRRIAMYFIPSVDNDNANVNVFNIQGKMYVATETPWMFEIDKDTLETIKRFNARENLNTTTATWLAHPHFESDGTCWFVSTKRFPSESYQIVKIPPTPGSRPLEGIEVETQLYCGDHGAGYYHSFALTENYIILIINPLFMTGTCDLLMMGFTHKSISELMKYHPEVGPRFRIINKHTKQELRECRGEAMMYFHTANSYETENEIIIDLSSYKDDTLIKMFYMKECNNMWKGETYYPPNLVRYRIPKKEILRNDPEPYKLPMIHEEGRDNEILGSLEMPIYNYAMVNGKDYNYCYGISGLGVYGTVTVVKVNVKTKESLHWYPPSKDIFPSAPFFVARPGGKQEDDGVIVANCTGSNGADSFFLVLDAKTMKEVCHANMHVSLGMMIHGAFFPE